MDPKVAGSTTSDENEVDNDGKGSDAYWLDLALGGTCRVAAGNGEFLDVEFREDAEPRLTTSTSYELRHVFSFKRIEDLGDHRIAVAAEPWEVTEDQGPLATPRLKDLAFGFALVQDGCSFQLEDLPPVGAGNPTAIPRASSPMRKESAGAGFAEENGGLVLELGNFDFLNRASRIGFPTFQGDELRAFQHIAREIDLEPRSPALTTVALYGVEMPDGIPTAAWKAVVKQLGREIEFRTICRDFFGQVETFVQNVFIGAPGLIESVATYIQLEDTSLVQIVPTYLMQGMASAVGKAPVPGAGVVSAALTALLQHLGKSPSVTEWKVTLAAARGRMTALFDKLITSVKTWRASVEGDWGRLQAMGVAIKKRTLSWPEPDAEQKMRVDARKALEISLYKDLLKLRWQAVVSNEAPLFKENLDWVDNYHKRRVNTWIEATPGQNHKEKPGYWVTWHWLGSGKPLFFHKVPDKRLATRLFVELGVPRKTVFREWGLTSMVLTDYQPGQSPTILK